MDWWCFYVWVVVLGVCSCFLFICGVFLLFMGFLLIGRFSWLSVFCLYFGLGSDLVFSSLIFSLGIYTWWENSRFWLLLDFILFMFFWDHVWIFGNFPDSLVFKVLLFFTSIFFMDVG